MSLSLSPDTFKMAFDSATIFTAQALPTPTDTSRQTPSRGPSHHRRRRQSSSPPAMPRENIPQNGAREDMKDLKGDEGMSPLDPRRFTPNLHASLVGQILTLQREVESRNKTVGHLEEFLHMNKAEKEKLDEDLKEQMKENNLIKRQMQAFESTTLAALGDITKEKDDVNTSLAEARQRLEASKSKLRAQEEEADRSQSLWDRDKQNWDMEKRNLETKAHLVEGRLKTVLNEIAAAQANGYRYPRTSAEFEDGPQDTWYIKGSDPTSSRSNSIKSQSRFSGQSSMTNEVSEYLDYRASNLSGLNGFEGKQSNGVSLAAELDFGGLDVEDENDNGDDVMSPDALPEEAQFHRRRPSVQSLSQDQKAWKLLGLLPEGIEHTTKEEGLTEKTAATLGNTDTWMKNLPAQVEKAVVAQIAPAASYMDSATQFSPPTSPKLRPQVVPSMDGKSAEKAPVIEHLANQSRKRISAPLTEQISVSGSVIPPTLTMVSAGCQTLEQPLSPPLTPVITIETSSSSPVSAKQTFETTSSTQTEAPGSAPLPSAGGREKRSSNAVPVIEIHPPGSRPPSSHTSVVLPPRTKNAGCQASITAPVSTNSVSVQTEATIPGKRFVDSSSRPLPKPVSQPAFPKSGLEKIDERLQQASRPVARRNPHRPPPIASTRPRVKTSVSAPVVDTYPGNNDSGPLSNKKPTGLRRPVRAGSLFAGFDSTGADDTKALKDFDISSDDELASAAPIRKTLSKVQNSWKLIPQSEDNFMGRLGSAKNSTEDLELDGASDDWLASLVPLEDQDPTKLKSIRSNAPTKPVSPSKISKQADTRRANTTAHAPRPSIPRRKNPSAPLIPKQGQAVVPPPFPVPTRSSSRRVPTSFSEGAQSPSPYSTTFFSNSRKRGVGRSPSKNPLRKVRSAAAVPHFGRGNENTKVPPQPLSPSTLASASPRIPKMPIFDISSRQPKETQQIQTTHALPPESLNGPASVDTPGQSISVVDAIAQTMVGEWMWKYVRRRKSFGKTEDIDFDENGTGNGLRHKRWVWLAPYERVIMWSSKQPTSGPALMGKNGRKLVIQSVLDVKDDAPAPKNSNPQTCFGRSILILTPQRALKFTATTQDRHYVWLTALSFLSHSPLGMEDLAMVPPLPRGEHQRPPSQHGGLRRTPIRDSIRIAKSKERPSMNGHSYSSPITTLHHERLEGPSMPTVTDEPDSDAAEPPAIPRTAAQSRTHARKRSSTGPRPMPPSSFHSFPAGGATASSRSLKTPPTQDFSSCSPRGPGASAPNSAHDGMSRAGSPDVHDPMPPLPLTEVRNNFFDSVGTVRMEAFVEERRSMERERKQRGHPPLGNSWAKGQGKKDLRYWGVGGERKGSDDRAMGVGMGLNDPFRGF